ncbi:MAG TPA: hypothetical protein VGJ08_16255 [Rhizomicrobium sp.]|jgi:hypothetical protein
MSSKSATALLCSAALVFVSMLYGCAEVLGQPPPPHVCQSAQQCVVQVDVSCTNAPCTVTVDHPNIASHGHAIVWEIVPKTGQSYLFKNPGGVFFKTASGQSAFPNCHAEMNDKKYRCQGNRDGKTYEYGIELVGTPRVSKLDPYVVND